MRSPLTVRVSDGVRDQQVTRFVKGLRFTKTAPGGHHSASVSLDVPDGIFGALGPADRIFIYDGRNASTVWDGYVENPGRTAVLGGGRYELSALGGVVLASDNARSVAFRSRSIEGSQWVRGRSTHPDATIEIDQAVVPNVSSIKTLFPPQAVIPETGLRDAATFDYTLRLTGQTLYAASVTTRAGREDSNFYAFIVGYDEPPTMHAVGFTMVDSNLSVTTGGDGDLVSLGIQYATGIGPVVAVPENNWAAFYNYVLTPALMDANGSLAPPIAVGTVRAHEVVHHVVGALLSQIDGNDASIEPTTYAIDNLTYLEAVKPSAIFDDLSLYEPDFLWEILGSDAAGKHRFAYRQWPTTPRYEIGGSEFTESGGELDLSNRIAVSWKDETGVDRVTVRTASVPALGSRTKDAEPITLPDGQGSQANAERIGDEVLAALNTPSRSGTAVVRQPIQDKLTGQMVMPWEIEAGYLVRVRDMGVDLRLTEMTYEDASCAASLTLGSPTLTQAQRLARLRR